MKDSDRLERIEKELKELREELQRRAIIFPQPYPVYPIYPIYPQPYWPWPNHPTITWTVTGGDYITAVDSPSGFTASNTLADNFVSNTWQG